MPILFILLMGGIIEYIYYQVFTSTSHDFDWNYLRALLCLKQNPEEGTEISHMPSALMHIFHGFHVTVFPFLLFCIAFGENIGR